MDNIITLWILEVFFGVFAIHSTLLYFKGKSFNWFHSLIWFGSVIIFAFTSGKLFG